MDGYVLGVIKRNVLLFLTLSEVNQMVSTIARECDENANIIFGHTYDLQMSDDIRITIVAKGFHALKVSARVNKSMFPAKLRLLAGNEFEKPTFQRVLKNNLVHAGMGSDDMIVRELKGEKGKIHVDEHATQFLVSWNDENYDILAFLRIKNK